MDAIPVLYLNPTAETSGAEMSLLALLEGLDRRAFTPILALPGEGPLAVRARGLGIRVLAVPGMIAFGESHRPWRMGRYVRSVRFLRDAARSASAQIVHSNSPRAAFSGGMAARWAGIRSVVHVRDIEGSPLASAPKAFVLDRLSDALIAVSRAAAAAAVSRRRSLARKVRVIYNGVDAAAIRSAAERGKGAAGLGPGPLAVCVGLLQPAKGQDVLLAATTAARRAVPGLRLAIVGGSLRGQDGGFRTALESRVESLGLRGAVVFTGFRDDVPAILKAADVVVHPAVYAEPLPRVLLEAGALRKAIVATRVGGVPEIVEDGLTGLLVEPGDPEALARAMAKLLTDPGLAGRLGAAAAARVETEFRLDRHAREVEALYREIVERRA